MNRYKGVDWLAVVLYPLAVILMEAFWVYPWLVWLGLWPAFAELRPALSLASVIIVLAVSLLVTRVSIKQNWPMWLIRCVIVGCGLVTILLVLRAEYGAGYAILNARWFIHVGQMLGATFIRFHPVVLAIPVLLYLWWRGIILGRTTSYFSNIYRSFLLGMVALIALIILWQLSSAAGTLEGPVTSVGFYVMAFFFFGLMAMAILHLYLMRSRMPREDAALTSAWRWLPIMLGVIGAIVIVGLGAASIFSTEFFTSIEQGAKVVFDGLWKIFNYILIPLNYVFEGIYYLLQLIVNWLRGEQTLQFSGTGNRTIEGMTEVIPKTIPPEVTMAIKGIAVAAIVAAIVYILAKAVYNYRAKRPRAEIEEIHESLWSWNGFKDDLRLFLGMMQYRFQRKLKKAAPYPQIDLTENDDWVMLDIRELYRHLLWEAAGYGVIRWKQETSDEYARRLSKALPGSSGPIGEITSLYEYVRYGDNQAENEQVDRANSLWRRLRRLLRRSNEGQQR